jgi:hypothetical protein
MDQAGVTTLMAAEMWFSSTEGKTKRDSIRNEKITDKQQNEMV